MRKSWKIFHDLSLILRSFWSFVLPVLEYCSAVWCSAADTHLKLMDKVVVGADFFAVIVLECDLAHCRSVAVLCILFEIRNIPIHPLSGALPLLYVTAHVTRGAFGAHRHLFLPPRCRTSQCNKIFALSVSLWNDLGCPVFELWD